MKKNIKNKRIIEASGFVKSFGKSLQPLYFLIAPHFLAKYYLLRDIKLLAHRYKFYGKLLDVGCGEKPYQGVFSAVSSYVGIDFPDYSRSKGILGEKPDLFFDNNYKKSLLLPFKDNNFDTVVSFQVLEHHSNPELCVREMVRVVKKGGKILISAPLTWSLHEIPRDYFRFTEYGLRKLFDRNQCTVLKVVKEGSIFSTIIVLLMDYLIEIANKNKIFYLFALLFYPILLAFSYLCILLDKIFPSHTICFNYLVLAEKK